jgi:hypothetical protein
VTYAVVSWQAPFPGVTLQWDPGTAQSAALPAISSAWGWLPVSAPAGSGTVGVETGSQVALLQSAIATAMGGDFATGDGRYLLPARQTLWRLDVGASGTLAYLRLVFASLADARAWGFNGTTINAVNTTGNVWRFESTFNTRGAWSGGCSRVVQDEPDIRYTTRVTSSPYTVGASTHVRLGSRDYRTVRWVYVDAAYIHALQAGETDFAVPAGRSAADPNNLFDGLVERFSIGAALRLTVQGRAPYSCRMVDEDPAVGRYATRVGSAGRRYDVELELERIP